MRALILLLILAGCGGATEDLTEAECLAHPRAACAHAWPGGYALCDDHGACVVKQWPTEE